MTLFPTDNEAARRNLDAAKRRKKVLDGKSGPPTFMLEPEIITIVSDPKHPLYDARILRPVTPEWIDEMDRNGNDLPVKVTKEGSSILCVWGRRRLAGLREANKRRLERGDPPRKAFVVVDSAPMSELQDQMIRENFHRRDSDVFEEALAVVDYLNSGRTIQEAALAFDATEPTIKNRRKAAKLAPKVQDAVRAKLVNLSVALRWHTLSHREQLVKLKERLGRGRRRKKRAPYPVPKPDVVRKVWEHSGVPEPVKVALRWALGEAKLEELMDISPDVADIFEEKT